MLLTPTDSRRLAVMVRNFTPQQAKAYFDYLADGGTVEEFYSKMEKHGFHDQMSHGNRGMGSGVAQDVLNKVKANGGLSVKMIDGSEPPSGFMVATKSEFGSIVSASDFFDPSKGPRIISDYLKTHKKELGKLNNYLGLWHNTQDNKVYLDVSENIKDKSTAIQAGRNRDQISIWDVANFEEIQTGGSGNVGKTASNPTTEYLGNDGRADRESFEGDLEQVSKTKIIYFEAGLKPILKHLMGVHDQRTHGNRGVASIRARMASGEFATRKELVNYLKGKGTTAQPTKADLHRMVSNSPDLTAEVTRLTNLKLLNSSSPSRPNFFTSPEQEKQWEQAFEDNINDPLGVVNRLAVRRLNNVLPENIQGLVNNAFTLTHTGVKRATGESVTLKSKVTQIVDVSASGDNKEIKIRGLIYDSNSILTGKFERTIKLDKEGKLSLSNDFLALKGPYQGTGYGTKFLNNVEKTLSALGGVNQYVHAANLYGRAGSAGSFVWAKRGYNWDRTGGTSYSADRARRNIESYLHQSTRSMRVQTDIKSILDKMTTLEQSHPDFPTPRQIAAIGYRKGAKTWAGQQIMGNTDWYGVKTLLGETPTNG